MLRTETNRDRMATEIVAEMREETARELERIEGRWW